MQLSIPFLLSINQLIDKSDELMILFDDKSKSENLKSFGEEYPNKRINIYFNISNDMDIVNIIEEAQLNNFVIVTDYFVKPDVLQVFNDKHWDYYILVPARTFYDIAYYKWMGVSDIFIADELWHNLPKVKSECGNIKLRMYGDRSGLYAKTFNKDNEAYYTMFVPRPEDYELLDKYIDVIQFNSNKANVLNVLYKVWFVQKKWIGRINELFSDNGYNNFDLYNASIPSSYTLSKITCGGRCLSGSPCRKCKHIYQLAETCLKKGVELRISDGI